MKLYELTDRIQQIMDMYEVGEIDQETYEDMIEALDMDWNEKAENVIKAIRNYEATANAKKEESKRLAEAAKSEENKAKSMKEYLKKQMIALGMTRSQAGMFTMSIRGNGGVAPLSVTASIDQLPEEFKVYEPKINNDAIRKYLEKGGTIDGCQLLPRGTSLNIK